jgi:hypothetical protein
MSDHLLPDAKPMEPLLTHAELVKTIAIAIIALGIAALAGWKVNQIAAAYSAQAAPAVSPQFTCPAPVRPGQVTTIIWRNDAGVISTRCQLVNDWQLLSPKGANKP